MEAVQLHGLSVIGYWSDVEPRALGSDSRKTDSLGVERAFATTDFLFSL